MLRELVDLYPGKIILPKIQVRPLEAAIDAHLEERGHTQGKVLAQS